MTIPYGSLLQALIAKDVKVVIPFEEGAAYNQGGEEPFGEDVPFQYSYKAVLSCR